MPDGTITTKFMSIGHDQNRYQSQIHAPSEASSAAVTLASAASGAETDSAEGPATSATSASAGVESSA